MGYSLTSAQNAARDSADAGIAGARLIREAIPFRRASGDVRAGRLLKKSQLTMRPILIKQRPN
jgi:hypothetical protein